MLLTLTILYATDGVTLFFTDRDGAPHSASPNQSERYLSFLAIMGAQQDAETTNRQALDAYASHLLNLQDAIDTGKPQPPVPLKPRQKVVTPVVASDGSVSGEVSFIDFSPALPDPKYPVVTPSSGIKATSGVPADRIDVVLNLLTVVNSKLDRLLAK